MQSGRSSPAPPGRSGHPKIWQLRDRAEAYQSSPTLYTTQNISQITSDFVDILLRRAVLGIALWKDLTVDRWQIRTKIAPEAPAKDVSLPPNHISRHADVVGVRPREGRNHKPRWS